MIKYGRKSFLRVYMKNNEKTNVEDPNTEDNMREGLYDQTLEDVRRRLQNISSTIEELKKNNTSIQLSIDRIRVENERLLSDVGLIDDTYRSEEVLLNKELLQHTSKHETALTIHTDNLKRITREYASIQRAYASRLNIKRDRLKSENTNIRNQYDSIGSKLEVDMDGMLAEQNRTRESLKECLAERKIFNDKHGNENIVQNIRDYVKDLARGVRELDTFSVNVIADLKRFKPPIIDQWRDIEDLRNFIKRFKYVDTDSEDLYTTIIKNDQSASRILKYINSDIQLESDDDDLPDEHGQSGAGGSASETDSGSDSDYEH
jgi:hypothetical protein